MYEKYGTYRFFAACIIGIGGLSIMSYMFRNRVKNLNNSAIIFDAKTEFYKNKKIVELMTNKTIDPNVKWSESIGGGLRNNNFDCVVYL